MGHTRLLAAALVAAVLGAACDDPKPVERAGAGARQAPVADAPAPAAPKTAEAELARGGGAVQPTRGVVLFVIDTLRADRLSTYGYERETSPNLTALAERGTRWTNNYAQGSWTLPSMLSMMTGLYLSQESEALPERQPALAELLSEAGVETAAFIGNRVVGAARGFERGFDHVETPPRGASSAEVQALDAHHWVDRFVAWQQGRADQNRPWFAWIHVLDPHAPYAPDKKYDLFQKGRTKDEQELLVPRWSAERTRVDELNAKRSAPTDHYAAVAAMLRDRSNYDGDVRQADDALGRLASLIRSAVGFDEVLLIVASDHGEMLYEYLLYPQAIERRSKWPNGLPRGLGDLFTLEHTGYLYEEVWRTPLVMIGPNIPAGRVVDDLSVNLDIAPTVLEALGVEYDGPLDGTSKFAEPRDRDAVFGHGVNTTAVRTLDGRILIEHAHKRFMRPATEPAPVQLLATGPSGTAVDRAAERPDDVADLRARIETWRASTRFQTNMNVDRAEADEALRALGYKAGGEGD